MTDAEQQQPACMTAVDALNQAEFFSYHNDTTLACFWWAAYDALLVAERARQKGGPMADIL